MKNRRRCTETLFSPAPVGEWAGGVVEIAKFIARTYLEGGCPRIARGEPWAGSVTGGEACGYPCSEKEGFTHPSLWRAPCFWGTRVQKLHAVDTYEPAF